MSVDNPTSKPPDKLPKSVGVALPSGTVGPGIPHIPQGFEAIPCQLQQPGGDTAVYGFLIRPVQSTVPPTGATTTPLGKSNQPKAILPKIAAKPPIAPYGNVEAQVEPCSSTAQHSSTMNNEQTNLYTNQWPSTSSYDYGDMFYNNVDQSHLMRHNDYDTSAAGPSTSHSISSMRPQLDWSAPSPGHQPQPPSRYPGKVAPQMAAISHTSDASATPDSGVHSINGSPQMHTPPMVSPGTTQPLHVDTTGRSHADTTGRSRGSFDDMPVLDAVNGKKTDESIVSIAVDKAMNPEMLVANLVSTMDPAQLRKFQAEISKQVKKKLKSESAPASALATVDQTIESVVAAASTPPSSSTAVPTVAAAPVPAVKKQSLKPSVAKKKKMNITFEDETKRREMASKLHLYRTRTARLMNRMEIDRVDTSQMDELTSLFENAAKISTILPSKFNKTQKSPFTISTETSPTVPLKKTRPTKRIERYYPTMNTTPPAFAVFSKSTSTEGFRSVSACSIRPPSKIGKKKMPTAAKDGSDDDSVFLSPTSKKPKIASTSMVPHKTYETRGIGSTPTKGDRCHELVEAARAIDAGQMKLPYDLWFEMRGAEKINPSVQYRKIRNNFYIDPIPSTSTTAQCDCTLTCGESCLNRQLFIECTSSCCGLSSCSNRRLQTRGTPRSVQLFDTKSNRGMGVRTVERIGAGAFLGEYVGEVITTERLHERQRTYYKPYNHHYAVAITSRHSIDAYLCGNIMRFINHSCQPNAVMQKWIVNGQPRCGVYALRDLDTDEEITYDYQFASHNKSQICLCGSENCRKTIAPPTTSSCTVDSTITTTAEKKLIQKRRTFLWRCRRPSITNAKNYAFLPRPRSNFRSSLLSPTPSTSHAKPTSGDVLLNSSLDLGYVSTSVCVDGEGEVDDGKLPAVSTGDDQVRCVCGCVDEDGQMVMCEKCGYWLHTDCTKSTIDIEPFECSFCTDSILSPPKRDFNLAELPAISFPNCTYFRAFDDRCTVRINEFVYMKRVINDRHKQRLTAFHQLVNKGGQMEKRELPADIEESDDELEEEMMKRSNLRVFRVHRLFKGPDNSRYVFGNYYARPHETFCEPTRRFMRQELLQTPLYDTLPLSAVVARCVVLDPVAYCKGRPIYPKYPDEDDVYMCEFRVDKAQRIFERIKDKTRLEFTTADYKDYMFESFKEKRTIKRNFTPFVLPSDMSTSPLSSKHQRPPTFVRQQRVERLTNVVKRMQNN